MRISRTQRAISAAVMTTLASATVVTFARGDDAPDPTVAALPAPSGGDTPSVTGSGRDEAGETKKTAEPSPSKTTAPTDDDDTTAGADTSATSGTSGSAAPGADQHPADPRTGTCADDPGPEPARDTCPVPSPRPPRDLIELLFGPQPGN